MPPPEKLRRAFAAYMSGDLGEAERLSRAVAAAKPDSFDAWHLLGFVQAAMGRGEKALQSYDRALALQPSHAEAVVNRGAALHELGRLDEALAAAERAVALNGGYPPAHANRGLALHALRRYGEALAAFDRAIALKRDYGDAHAHRAATLFALDRREDALASYDRALAVNPRDAASHFNRGNVLRALGRLADARAAYERALAIDPKHRGALANRGAALHEARRFAEALAAFDALIALSPQDAEAHYNRGNALHDLGRFAEAASSFDKALAIKPDFVEALYNRGNALFAQKLYAEALAAFERTRAARPDHPYALERAANCVLQLCDWTKRGEYEQALAADIKAGRAIVSPFTLLGFSGDPALQLECARRYVAAAAPVVAPKPPLAPRGAKIRVAYCSADFREHAIAYLIAELFELHDRAAFEIVGVSFGRDDGGPMRKRIAASFDRFIDARAMSDAAVVEALRALDIDIAVDLTGHTADSRLGIFARRAAPIQVSYTGFAGTMGAQFIDYVLLDSFVAPAGADAFFSEKIVRLPHSYYASDRKRPIAERTTSREEAGLPPRGFVFCCFNNVWKIAPDVFDIWMRLLRAVDGAVLWLLPSNQAAEDNLKAEAARRGVDPARLVFAPRKGLAEHLARHRLADLFLDTLPYNAHTTASDALWAGLPVLTRPGEAFASRVAASQLQAIGLADLIAPDEAAYETLALQLAREPARLADVKRRLAANRSTAPLFDTPRLTRAIESAFAAMIERELSSPAKAGEGDHAQHGGGGSGLSG
ncbi:MAG TPA: tetratricopeptide repeat protein [Roseiarcus sp.]|nr:tetratricopeptide repeat protein [Roseiarcus sp.]